MTCGGKKKGADKRTERQVEISGEREIRETRGEGGGGNRGRQGLFEPKRECECLHPRSTHPSPISPAVFLIHEEKNLNELGDTKLAAEQKANLSFDHIPILNFSGEHLVLHINIHSLH